MSRKPSKEEQAAIRAALDAALDDLDDDEEESEEEVDEEVDEPDENGSVQDPSNVVDDNDSATDKGAEVSMAEKSEAVPSTAANSESPGRQEDSAAANARPPTPVALDAKLQAAAAAAAPTEEKDEVPAGEAKADIPSAHEPQQPLPPHAAQDPEAPLVGSSPPPTVTAVAAAPSPAAHSPAMTQVNKSGEDAEEDKDRPFLGPPRPPPAIAAPPPPPPPLPSSSSGGKKKKKSAGHHHTTDPDKLFMEMMEDMLLTEQEGVTGPDEMMMRLVQQLQDELHELEEEAGREGSDDADDDNDNDEPEQPTTAATAGVEPPAAGREPRTADTNEEALVAPLEVDKPAAPVAVEADASPPPLAKVSTAGDPLPALRSEPSPPQSTGPEPEPDVAKPASAKPPQPSGTSGESAPKPDAVDPERSKSSKPSSSAKSSSSGPTTKPKKAPARPRSQNPPPSSTDGGDAQQDLDAAISQLIRGMAQQATTSADGPDEDPDVAIRGEEADLLKLLMKGLNGVQGGGSGGGGGDDDDDDFNADAMIDGMMEQLLSKDLMYDPMKQVAERFPKWLDERRNSLSAEELKKRQQQCDCFQKLVLVYETRPDDTARLMALMQEVQEYGQPPAEIVRDIAPGMELDANGLPKLEGGPFPPFGGAGDSDECRVM